MSEANRWRLKRCEPPYAEVESMKVWEDGTFRIQVRCPYCGQLEVHLVSRIGTHVGERCRDREAFGYVTVRPKQEDVVVDGRNMARRRVTAGGGA